MNGTISKLKFKSNQKLIMIFFLPIAISVFNYNNLEGCQTIVLSPGLLAVHKRKRSFQDYLSDVWNSRLSFEMIPSFSFICAINANQIHILLDTIRNFDCKLLGNVSIFLTISWNSPSLPQESRFSEGQQFCGE